jgi:periplasmic divalent cation tolerance protein
MDSILVYITAKDKDQAKTIGRKLVEEKLAACVNIIDGMESIYWWEEKVCEDRETVLIVKTRESLLDKLTARVKSLHSYECPCVVALRIAGGNEDYLRWIEGSVIPD